MDANYIANKYSLISFDIFDTLINRNVKNPKDIFDIVELKYNAGNLLPIRDFRKKRLEARDASIEKYANNTVTINEIYSCLDYPKDVVLALKQLEVETELEFCTPNEDIVKFYKELCSLKCHIVLLSDMYLPSKIIQKALEQCGIKGYEKLYVSCDYKESKSNLQLFKRVCNEYKISPQNLLHIGDNWNTDYIKPLLLGIRPVHIKADQKGDYYNLNKLSEQEQLLYNCLTKIIGNHVHQCSNDFEKIGYEIYAPLLYGFSLWLDKSLKEHGVRKVFFLAREGAILKQVFDRVHLKQDIETFYFYGSRKSLVFPSLWLYPDYDSFSGSIILSCRATVQDFFDKICLPIENYTAELKACGLTNTTEINGHDLINNQSLRNLYQLVSKDLMKRSREEYRQLEQYLYDIGFCGKIAIVDIGWNGSMQKALQKLPFVKENVSLLNGYYLGINNTSLGGLKNAFGYIYDNQNGLSNRYLIYGFSGPFELALTALHGTTSRYEKTENGIKPVLLQNEYINPDNSFMKEYSSTRSIQKGIMLFINDIKKIPSIANMKWSSKVAFRNCKLFGQSPLQKHINLYRDYVEYDGATPYTLISNKYRHLRGNYSFQKGFWNSTWKIGYLKDLFKLPLPYYKLYTKLKQKEEQKTKNE